MNSDRALIASILFLGLGLGLILGYCHDSTISFSGAYPIAGAALQIAINTSGLPAMIGLASTLIGVLFFFTALVLTVLKLVAQHAVTHEHGAPVA
jgi:hypothetical protein